MGGRSTRIPGNFDESNLTPVPLKKNSFDRILFRERYEKPIEIKFTDFTYIEIPNTQLSNEISKRFVSYLRHKTTNPSKSTMAIFDYHSMGVMSSAHGH